MNNSFYDQMGKPISRQARANADAALREMGVADRIKRWDAIAATADYLERDRPHEALEVAGNYVDLSGAYRLMATLLTPTGVTV